MTWFSYNSFHWGLVLLTACHCCSNAKSNHCVQKHLNRKPVHKNKYVHTYMFYSLLFTYIYALFLTFLPTSLSYVLFFSWSFSSYLANILWNLFYICLYAMCLAENVYMDLVSNWILNQHVVSTSLWLTVGWFLGMRSVVVIELWEFMVLIKTFKFQLCFGFSFLRLGCHIVIKLILHSEGLTFLLLIIY